MKTDIQLFKIFAMVPQFFFDLIGIYNAGKYTFKSETIKEISRSMDGLIEPDDKNMPHFVVEFQMQKDRDIYYRLIMEMAALGAKNQEPVYHGIIIFANKSVNLQCEPWSSIFNQSNPAFRFFYLGQLLQDLKEKNPNHPLIFVFQPYLQKDKTILEQEASKHYNKIMKCNLPEDVRKSLCSVFVSWMMICFKDKTYKEVLKMLSLTTPLEETVSYKELVAIGEKKGEKRGEKKGEKKVAIRMFQQGYKPEIIHKLTGVPFKDLQKLQ